MTDLQMAFMYGFYVSREGYNAEHLIRSLAPISMSNENYRSFADFCSVRLSDPNFVKLMNQAMRTIEETRVC